MGTCRGRVLRGPLRLCSGQAFDFVNASLREPFTALRRTEWGRNEGSSLVRLGFSFDSLNPPSRIYYLNRKEVSMADAPRITVDELKRRMDAGEDFTVIDVRNPQAWAEAETVIPEAIRVNMEELDQSLPRIPKNKSVVAYCT